MDRNRLKILALLLSVLSISGCAAVAAGTAGGLIVDEGIMENDDQFDPLENTEPFEGVYD